MRYINKGEEPESFTTWKALANEDWTPTYDDLRGQEKTDLYNALLREQGFYLLLLWNAYYQRSQRYWRRH
jgi:hypothetical protein